MRIPIYLTRAENFNLEKAGICPFEAKYIIWSPELLVLAGANCETVSECFDGFYTTVYDCNPEQIRDGLKLIELHMFQGTPWEVPPKAFMAWYDLDEKDFKEV